MEKENKEELVENQEKNTAEQKPQEQKEVNGAGSVSKLEDGKATSRKKKKNTIGWIAAASIVVIATVVTAVLVYLNSPGYKAQQALLEGQNYMEEMDYERAVAKFAEALNIDPANEKITSEIYGQLNNFLKLAQEHKETGNYEAERQMASYVLLFDVTNEQNDDLLFALPQTEREQLFNLAKDLVRDVEKRDLITQGDAEFEKEKYEEAKEKYEEAVEKGAEEAEVPRLPLCNAYLKLLDLCEAKDWEGVAKYMDSADFDPIAERMEEQDPQYVSRKVNVLIGKVEELFCVMVGDLTPEKLRGNGVEIVSAVNTYAVYQGWLEYGQFGSQKAASSRSGILQIWYKNEGKENAIMYSGMFKKGVMDGSGNLWIKEDNAVRTLKIDAKNGYIAVYEGSPDGKIWLIDIKEEHMFAVDGQRSVDNRIANYVVGIPGYGGSDRKLEGHIVVEDVFPPSFALEKEVGVWYKCSSSEIPVGEGVTASDNIDGDITDRITYSTQKTRTNYQTYYDYNYDDWEYALIVVYSVSDTAGNEAVLTVKYEYENICGDSGYTVVSIE